jgi:hypothetical protein
LSSSLRIQKFRSWRLDIRDGLKGIDQRLREEPFEMLLTDIVMPSSGNAMPKIGLCSCVRRARRSFGRAFPLREHHDGSICRNLPSRRTHEENIDIRERLLRMAQYYIHIAESGEWQPRIRRR